MLRLTNDGKFVSFAEWDESRHPRAEDGKFSKGGGGRAKKKPAASTTAAATTAAATTAAATAGKPKLPVSFGKSGVDVTKPSAMKWSQVEEWTGQILAKSRSDDLPGPDDLADFGGAPDGAQVRVWPTWGPGHTREIEIKIDHPDFEQQCVRRLRVDKEGNPYIYNELIDIKKGSQGKGLGTTVFGREIEAALEFGVHYIACHAARYNTDGDSYFNGYYTWPLLGYDQTLDSLAKDSPDVAAAAREKFPGVESVLDVIESPGGREWWKENGTDMHHARFDLSPGSRSLAVFSRYLEAREAKKKGGA